LFLGGERSEKGVEPNWRSKKKTAGGSRKKFWEDRVGRQEGRTSGGCGRGKNPLLKPTNGRGVLRRNRRFSKRDREGVVGKGGKNRIRQERVR